MKKPFKMMFLAGTAVIPMTFASGLSKPVLIGPKAVGMGGAFVGIADDATSVYHNPAAMQQMQGQNFYLGMDSLITDLNYTPEIAGTPVGPEESAKQEFLPVPNGAITARLANRVSFGLGVFFPHGNGGEFSGTSGLTTALATTPGVAPTDVATNPTEGRIYSMEIAPAMAFTLFDGFSVGGSFRATRISSTLKGQTIAFTDNTTDFVTKLDADGWGFGYSASMFYRPVQKFSVGFNYRSEISTTLEGNASLNSAGEVTGSLKQNLPTQYNAGVGLYPSDRITVGVGFQFEQNSQIENFDGTVTSTTVNKTLSIPQNWDDSYTWMIGVDAKATENLSLRAGFAKDFDQSIPDTANNRIIGDIAAQEASAGIAYQWNNLNLAATWNARWGSRTIIGSPATGQLAPGEYDAFLQSVSVGLGYKM